MCLKSTSVAGFRSKSCSTSLGGARTLFPLGCDVLPVVPEWACTKKSPASLPRSQRIIHKRIDSSAVAVRPSLLDCSSLCGIVLCSREHCNVFAPQHASCSVTHGATNISTADQAPLRMRTFHSSDFAKRCGMIETGGGINAGTKPQTRGNTRKANKSENQAPGLVESQDVKLSLKAVTSVQTRSMAYADRST